MVDFHTSQASPLSKEAHSSARISAKSSKQNDNSDSDPIHSDVRYLSEHNQIVLDHSAHNPGVEMRTDMSDADMEDQQADG